MCGLWTIRQVCACAVDVFARLGFVVQHYFCCNLGSHNMHVPVVLACVADTLHNFAFYAFQLQAKMPPGTTSAHNQPSVSMSYKNSAFVAELDACNQMA